jgi:hypothetical protein
MRLLECITNRRGKGKKGGKKEWPGNAVESPGFAGLAVRFAVKGNHGDPALLSIIRHNHLVWHRGLALRILADQR